MDNKNKKPNYTNKQKSHPASVLAPLAALSSAALILPGLLYSPAQAADEDSVDFQYSHYQEGKRAIYGLVETPEPSVLQASKLPQNLNPIEVDSIHGSGRFTLTDRIKFAFNYTQDTWSGATPFGTAPAVYGVSNPRGVKDSKGNFIAVGASPYAAPQQVQNVFIDRNLNFYSLVNNPHLGSANSVPALRNNQLTHVMSTASPETRKQGDFKLSYEWDEAVLDIGGGISVENDYESRFANLGGRFDFNQKQTTVNWGVSYTNSDTFATIDPDARNFYDPSPYYNSSADFDNAGNIVVKPVVPTVPVGYIESTYAADKNREILRTNSILHGNREDWGSQLGLTQVLGKNSLLSLDLGYTRSTGYLANPYKVVYAHFVNFKPGQEFVLTNLEGPAGVLGYIEVRPDERNLFNWHLGYDQFIEPLNAALHFDYHFAHDDWSINAHTFEADWVQPLGAGWTVTPRIRYYSQSAADFYTRGIFQVFEGVLDRAGEPISGKMLRTFPKYFSSDQRLSGFGTLSGGVTVNKQFAKGISLETGFEYYTHQGSLKLGGGGEQAFADYDYWVANAALKVNLGALNTRGSGDDGHGGHHQHNHSNSPAGVMFDHALPKSGDFMVGYRYMRSEQSGDVMLGSHPASINTVRADGCGGRGCAVTPNFMAMNMHMLDLMVAPTDWLTLMLMPQWADMEMTMTANPNVHFNTIHGDHPTGHAHQTGGVGDLGIYALFKVFDKPHHHLTLSFGGTAPTGDADINLRKTLVTPVDNQRIHYGMQLGSGTWDFKPSLTYMGEVDEFLWGAQATGTVRLEDHNESGFAFGDIFQGSVWGGYHWTNWLATTVRGVYTSQGKVHGAYPASTEIDSNTGLPFVLQHIGPFDFPANYGGQFVDLGLGVNVTIPSGAFQGNTLKFEWLQPVHTDYNGYQLDRDYGLAVSWSYGF